MKTIIRNTPPPEFYEIAYKFLREGKKWKDAQKMAKQEYAQVSKETIKKRSGEERRKEIKEIKERILGKKAKAFSLKKGKDNLDFWKVARKCYIDILIENHLVVTPDLKEMYDRISSILEISKNEFLSQIKNVKYGIIDLHHINDPSAVRDKSLAIHTNAGIIYYLSFRLSEKEKEYIERKRKENDRSS